MEARGNLKLVRDWNGNKEGGWCSQVKVENVFHFESSFSCFPLFLLFSSRPSWHQNCKLRWESLMTHFACFDLSVPVANWFLVLEGSGSASISLVTVYYKGLFSRDLKDLRGTVNELYLEQVLSWAALGWSRSWAHPWAQKLTDTCASLQSCVAVWSFLLPGSCARTLKPLGSLFLNISYLLIILDWWKIVN